MRELIRKYGLMDEAREVEEKKISIEEWYSVVDKKVREKGKEWWWKDASMRSKLRRYVVMKGGVEGWGMEKWMEGEWSHGKRIKFRWRSGSCGLNEDMGRREGRIKTCVMDGCDEEETVEHIMWECVAYKSIREDLKLLLMMECSKFNELEWLKGFYDEGMHRRTTIMMSSKDMGRNVKDEEMLRTIIDNLSIQFITKLHEFRVTQLYDHPMILHGGANGASCTNARLVAN